MNKETNWEKYKFKSGLIMDVSKCPSCKKPRSNYLLRNAGPPGDDNIEVYSKAFKESGECCNSECRGDWGTGCWHCHSPEYFFGSLSKEGPKCITDGCDNKGTVYRHCGEKSLVARCPDCDDVLIAKGREFEIASVANRKESFYKESFYTISDALLAACKLANYLDEEGIASHGVCEARDELRRRLDIKMEDVSI